MIKYRRVAPKRYKCLYCGYSPLEIWAFVWIDEQTKKEKSTPVLVCMPFGCGTFFDPHEFGLHESSKDLRTDLK